MRILLVGLISVVGLLPPPSRADEEVSGETEHLREAAQLAVYSGDLDLLQALLKAKLQMNAPVVPDSGDTLLHLAVSAGKLEVVRYLIKQGANPLVRDKWDQQPIDKLDWSRPEVAPLLQALERPLASFDKTTLAGVPVPVWREVLGPAVAAPDPLEPPPQPKAGERKMAQYIALENGMETEDPPKELGAVLNSRFPGWKPISALDKQSKEPFESIRLMLAPLKSTDLATDDHGPLITYVQQHPLPAYSFKVRTNHATLWRGGELGYVVLIGGYWVKVAAHLFEE